MGPKGSAVIQFTPESWVSFKKAYAKAVETKQDEFTWRTHEFVTNYAKYLIEYWDPKIAKPEGDNGN